MSGVFQINRGIFSSDIWNNQAEFRVFFYILGNAVWKEEGVQMGSVLVGRGQYLRSYRNLREDLMYMENNAIKYYSLSYIKKITDKLVRDGRIEKTETELGTLFTVLNYSKYQWLQGEVKSSQEQRKNGERTEQEQNKNNKNKDNTVNKDNKYIYIVEYLNKKTDKNFKHTTKTTQRFIEARLNEGFTVDDFMKVIDIKCNQWAGSDMAQYLRPQTLFGTKFESYLNEGGQNGEFTRGSKEDIPEDEIKKPDYSHIGFKGTGEIEEGDYF